MQLLDPLGGVVEKFIEYGVRLPNGSVKQAKDVRSLGAVSTLLWELQIGAADVGYEREDYPGRIVSRDVEVRRSEWEPIR